MIDWILQDPPVIARPIIVGSHNIGGSRNELFNDEAIEAAMKWLFIPAVMNKGTVAVWATVPFRFRLNRL